MPLDTAKIMMMPSSEGLEIWEATKRGALTDNMHFVDYNPAIVAHLTRNNPGSIGYGVDLARAGKRISHALRDHKNKGCHILNADLCSPVGSKLIAALKGVHRAAGKEAIVSVTVLRGREQGSWFRLIKKLQEVSYDASQGEMFGSIRVGSSQPFSQTDIGRFLAIVWPFTESQYVVYPIRCGIYKSTAGNQTMMFVIFRLMDVHLWSERMDEANTQYNKLLATTKRPKNILGFERRLNRARHRVVELSSGMVSGRAFLPYMIRHFPPHALTSMVSAELKEAFMNDRPHTQQLADKGKIRVDL